MERSEMINPISPGLFEGDSAWRGGGGAESARGL